MKYDLTGKRFGNLIVLKEIGKNKWQSVEWLCKCDCGNYHITQSKYLVNGDTVSCDDKFCSKCGAEMEREDKNE